MRFLNCFNGKIDRNFHFTVTRTTTWSDNQVLTASALNGEFNNLGNAVSIVNADISGSAGIVGSKLANPLTGLTLSTDTFTSCKQTVQSFTPSAGATQNIDLSLGSYILITMPAGNITLTFTNGAVGQFFVIRITQDSVGGRTVSYPGGVTWAGSAPTNSGANKVDMYGFGTPSSTTAWDGCVVFQNR